MRIWIIMAAVSLAPTGLAAATPCDSCVTCDAGACQSCNSCTSDCVICRCHRNLRPIRVEKWCVTTEPICVSWCKLFSCFNKNSGCSSSGCDSPGCDSAGCNNLRLDAPTYRSTRVRPKNRLIRKTEYRLIPILGYTPESQGCEGNCHCDTGESLADLKFDTETLDHDTSIEVTESLSSEKGVPGAGPTIHWLDNSASPGPTELGIWTADGSHKGRDATSPPTVHWVSGPPTRIDTNENLDEKPIYRVTDTVEPTLAPVIDGPR